jgi:phage gp29-like protein
VARIQTLGIADFWPAGQAQAQNAQDITGAPPAQVVDGEWGAAGTPIFAGFLTELGEYNPQFQGGPFACFPLYEQMRRSDSTVAAMLLACRLPVTCAEWMIVTPDLASPIEKEAAAFVKENLFACNFKKSIENAMLMLDFGCAVHEDVWEIDSNRIRLKRMAPRLPLTFYRWITKPGTDELIALDQLGYRAGNYVNATLPAGKMALFTFQQEGANFAGRALTRAMYPHWYTKQALYAIDAITCERNGMGVPVITLGPNASKQDRLAAIQWVQQLIAHEKTGITIPPGWTFELAGVKGMVKDCMPSIQHHNMQIALAALGQFHLMGQEHGSGGNRSLGETMSDFFLMSLQSTADMVGDVFSKTSIRRMVNFNFPGVKRYPRLVPQQVLAFKIDAIVDAVSKMGTAKMMTPDDEMEAWLRKKLGAPEKPADAGTGSDPEEGNDAVPTELPGAEAPQRLLQVVGGRRALADSATGRPARKEGPKSARPDHDAAYIARYEKRRVSRALKRTFGT